MNHFLTVFSINKPQILLQPILVLALAVALVSLTGAGVLGQPWNQFDVLVQDLGWSEEAIISPTLDSTLELRLTQIPGTSGGGPPPPGFNSFEDFEAGFTTWINTSGDNNDCWRRDSSGTPTGNTGPSTGAVGTTFYVFYESSDGCSPGTGSQAFLAGPTIDFNSFNDIDVTFWRHMWDGIGSDQMGRLALELEDSPGSGTFTEVWFQQGNQGNQWDQITVDLSAEDGTGPRQLRFIATEVVAGFHSDMAVDEVTIQGVAAGGTINLITSCVFHSDEDILAGTGLSQGTAICKLLDAPVDQGGNAIAEGRTFFKSYTGSDDLEVFISEFVFENSNDNELIFDIKFIIESPV